MSTPETVIPSRQAIATITAAARIMYPHDLGTARMSARFEDGVVNDFGGARDVPYLFASDGSVMTTGAAANPTLTIVALALCPADRIEQQMKAGSL